MNRSEQDELLERARASLREEFEARENEITARHAAAMAEAAALAGTRLDSWSRTFAEARDRDKHAAAVDAAGLAVAVARKIIRDTVDVDPDFVVRTLETALFKVEDGAPLTVILHPEDAALISGQPDLMRRLRIRTVVPDRRVEKGGCRIRAGVREWDATLSRQMDTLIAVVEETLDSVPGTVTSDRGDADERPLD